MNDPYTVIALLLILCLLVLGVYVLIKRWAGAKRIYKSKGPYLLSEGERRFFEALQHSISPEIYVCPKVRIADLVEMAITQEDKDFWPKFNRISQKHVDFVLCDKQTFAPLLIVEMDGGSHNDNSRSLRDQLVDEVFKGAEIPMLHVRASGFYSPKELSAQILQAMSRAVPAADPIPANNLFRR